VLPKTQPTGEEEARKAGQHQLPRRPVIPQGCFLFEVAEFQGKKAPSFSGKETLAATAFPKLET
jgi:hypothetical protein